MTAHVVETDNFSSFQEIQIAAYSWKTYATGVWDSGVPVCEHYYTNKCMVFYCAAKLIVTSH
jgi:hypothetical protein